MVRSHYTESPPQSGHPLVFELVKSALGYPKICSLRTFGQIESSFFYMYTMDHCTISSFAWQDHFETLHHLIRLSLAPYGFLWNRQLSIWRGSHSFALACLKAVSFVLLACSWCLPCNRFSYILFVWAWRLSSWLLYSSYCPPLHSLFLLPCLQWDASFSIAVRKIASDRLDCYSTVFHSNVFSTEIAEKTLFDSTRRQVHLRIHESKLNSLKIIVCGKYFKWSLYTQNLVFIGNV